MYFKEVEKSSRTTEREVDQLYVLTGALKVLGLEGAANAYTARLGNIKKRLANNQYTT